MPRQPLSEISGNSNHKGGVRADLNWLLISILILLVVQQVVSLKRLLLKISISQLLSGVITWVRRPSSLTVPIRG